MNVYDVLRYPYITEKSTVLKDDSDGRVLTFEVRCDAGKHQIKEAVEKVFEVKVDRVRTARYLGKWRRQGRTRGRKPSWKKAYVKLKPGQKTIEFFES